MRISKGFAFGFWRARTSAKVEVRTSGLSPFRPSWDTNSSWLLAWSCCWQSIRHWALRWFFWYDGHRLGWLNSWVNFWREEPSYRLRKIWLRCSRNWNLLPVAAALLGWSCWTENYINLNVPSKILTMSVMPVMPMMPGNTPKKCLEDILKLLVLEVLSRTTSSLILRSLPVLFRAELIIMSAFICVDEGGVRIRYFLKYLFGTWVMKWVPSAWFLSGWNRSARVL